MSTREVGDVDKCALCGREDITDPENTTRWTTEDGHFVDIPESIYVFVLAETSLGKIYICEHCYLNQDFRNFTKKDMAEIHHQFGLEYRDMSNHEKSLQSLINAMEFDGNKERK
jgi:hypothetical protein